MACCGGFLEVADFLIKAGADIELGASTPLMEAAQEGHLDLVRYLLEANAHVNAVTGTGDTALTYACENGHTEVADLLLKYNAKLEHESEGDESSQIIYFSFFELLDNCRRKNPPDEGCQSRSFVHCAVPNLPRRRGQQGYGQ